MEKKYIAHVFTLDQDGSEFIFPIGWYGYFSDDPDAFPASISIEAMGMGIMLGGITWTQNTREFPVKENGAVDITYLPVEVSSPAFLHGAATIYLLSGPAFDKAVEEHEKKHIPPVSTF